MKKFFRAVFFLNIACGAGLFLTAGSGMPRLYLLILGVVGGISLKFWLSYAREEEQAEGIWGRYDRPGASKTPRYNDL